MWSCLILIIYINLIIYIFGYIFSVFSNTEIDPFQKNFGFEEKKRIFNYTNIGYRYYLSDFEYTCKNYQDLILDSKTQKLADVFDLNFDSLHICALFMIIYLFYIFFHSLFDAFYVIIVYCFGIIFSIPESFITFLFKCLRPCLSLLNGIIFIISIFVVYSGGINSYFHFLSCKNINYDALKKYRQVENIRSDFRMFAILYVIFIFSTVMIWRTLRRNQVRD